MTLCYLVLYSDFMDALCSAFLIFWIVAVVIEVLVLVVGLLFFIGPGFLGPKIFEYL